MQIKAFRSLTVLALLGLAEPALAGFYVAPEIKWGSFSARPEAGEATPNYYGYGGGLHLGFSAKQVFDMGAYGTYMPGTKGAAEFGAGDATFVTYGGELALRMSQAVYFGLHGGVATYDLKNRTRPEELPGTWSGPSGGLAIGAIHALSKQSFIQTTVDFTHAVVKSDDAAAAQGLTTAAKRRFDAFTLSIGYVFNDYSSYLIENTIFKGFLDSMNFF